MLNEDAPSLRDMSLHPHMAWLSEVLLEAGLIRGSRELMRSGASQAAKTFYLSGRPDVGKPERRLVVRFFAGSNSVAPEWPGEVSLFESLPQIDLPVPEKIAVFRNRPALRACVVLHDLRDTHDRAWDAAKDSDAARTKLIAAVARVHGEWWPAKGVREGMDRSPFGMEALLRRDRAVVARAADVVDRVAHIRPDVRSWMAVALNSAVAAKQARMLSCGALTRVHGSPSLGALWLPREAGSGSVTLTDWEDWRVDLWASDIARLLMDDTSGRLSLESALAVYRAALSETGIDDYPESEMVRDVEACLPFEMAVGILQGRATASRTDHWRKLAGQLS